MTLRGQEARINAKQIEAKRFTSVASVLRGLEKLVEPNCSAWPVPWVFVDPPVEPSLVSIPHPVFFTFSAYFPNEEKVLYAPESTQTTHDSWALQVSRRVELDTAWVGKRVG